VQNVGMELCRMQFSGKLLKRGFWSSLLISGQIVVFPGLRFSFIRYFVIPILGVPGGL